MINNRLKFSRTFIDRSTNFRLTNGIDHAKSKIHNIAFSLYNKQKGKTSLTREKSTKLDFNLTHNRLKTLKEI